MPILKVEVTLSTSSNSRNRRAIEKEGSFGVVMRRVRNRKLGKDGAKAALRRLVASGWRCDGQLYEGLLRAVEDL